MISKILKIATAAILLSSTQASALTTLSFSGKIDRFFDDGMVAWNVQVGDPFSGKLTYDETATPLGFGPNEGAYPAMELSYSFSNGVSDTLAVDSFEPLIVGRGRDNTDIVNSSNFLFTTTKDGISVIDLLGTAPEGTLGDYSLDALETALRTNPELFSFRLILELEGMNPFADCAISPCDIVGAIDTISISSSPTTVPLPATAALLGMSLLTLGSLARTRRKAQAAART